MTRLSKWIAISTSTAALTFAAGSVAPAWQSPHRPHASEATVRGQAVAAFAQDMRKLWSDHVIWTREYIVAALASRPEAQAAAARLMANQEQIGAAMTPFYGAEAGRKLTTLLKEHITVAVDLVEAARSGDRPGLARADAKWQQNGIDIASFLASANPHWPKAALIDMMKGHLATTTQTVVARLNQQWADDVRAFDAVYTHILQMSDALAAGIVNQFPQRFILNEGMPSQH